jgi:hypothetical protein
MAFGHLPFRVAAIAVSDGGCNGGLINVIERPGTAPKDVSSADARPGKPDMS